MALISTCVFNLIFLMQKHVVNEIPALEKGNLLGFYRRLFTNPIYITSYVIMICGGAVFVVALRLAGLAVVMPLMNFGLLVLVFGARRYLGEALSLPAIIAIGLLILMPGLIVIADVAGPQETRELSRLLQWVAGGLAVAIGFAALTKMHPIFWPVLIGVMNTIGALCLQGFSLGVDPAQPTAQLAQNSLFLAGTIVFSLGGQTFLNPIGLQRLNATTFGPIQMTVNNLTTILVGVFLYRQTVGNVPVYLLGLGFGLVAIVCLSKYQAGAKP